MNQRKLPSCAIVLMLLLCWAAQQEAHSQLSKPHRIDLNQQQYIIDAWRTEEGLPQNSVNEIVQTRDGYLWLATYDGLVRFNGVRFTVYTTENSPLKSNRILALHEDAHGTLWIGTEHGGLTKLSRGVFTTYTVKDGLSRDVVLTVRDDSKGNLWIGTSAGGLNHYADGKLSVRYSTNNGLRNDVVSRVYEDSKGNLWIGTGAGLHVISDGKIRVIEGLPNATISTICEDNEGAIWVATFAGLVRLKDGKVKVLTKKDGLMDDRVMSLLQDQNGVLWIGGWTGVIQMKGGEFITDPSVASLSGIAVKSIFQDREQNIWLGFDGGGLKRLRKRAVNVYTTEHGLSNDGILGILQDHKGSLWVATNCSGLNKLTDGRFTAFTLKDGLLNNCVWSLWEDRSGSLWVGTWGGGLSKFSNGRFVSFTEETGLSNNVVFAIYEDSRRNLWVGTADGLDCYRNGRFTIYNTNDGLPHRNIRAIYEDQDSSLWIGTMGGLARFSNGTFTSYTTNNGLSNNFVRAIYQDSLGALWIGTYGGGLNRFRDGKFTVYNTSNGLYDNGVFAILEDSHGYFWFSSNRGIFRVQKQELNDVAEGRKKTITSVAYGVSEGMVSVECNGGFQPAGWKDRDGRLWFSTIKGLVMIDPDRIRINTAPPPVVVERFVADGIDQPMTQPIQLAPGTDKLEFHYAGLSFSAPEKVRYKYLLEGYDKAWVDPEVVRFGADAGPRHIAYYTNIPPGMYTFRVKAANADGIWNDVGKSLTFELRPFFHQTRLFYVLCGLVVVLMIVGFYFLRVRSLVRRTVELEGRVAYRTEELHKEKDKLARVNDDLNKLLVELEQKSRQLEGSKLKAEEANRAKTQFLAIVSHELRTPLNSVIGFTNVLLKNKRHNLQEDDLLFLDRILDNGKHLLGLIDQMLNLSKIEAGVEELHIAPVLLNDFIRETVDQLGERFLKKEVELLREVPEFVQSISTDAGKLKQILINLVGNAMKFTERGSVTIRLESNPETQKPLRIDVIDTGIGISPDRYATIFEPFKQADSSTTRKYGGTGLGLAVSKTLAELLGYRIEVHSELGKGSRFSIVLDHKMM